MEKKLYYRGVKLIFTKGHISLEVAFKGLNVIQEVEPFGSSFLLSILHYLS